ncbi:MAG: SlyX family protein [Treponema sp.]|jgi:SlyX protein|nr:SlyX family protein [Treponema sp.]MBQ1644582.1 SlyX family protein [Treponema sp.]MBQ1670291.1 SlyX family protein [Treponema sp.]MBQ1712908.1 SlyX family protein [Treponema sp.]MBQ1728489.1 SlyX family protein [Treponema sp.]
MTEDELKAMTERLDKLEIKLSYMEDFVQQLQDVVTSHTQTIEVLRKENKILSGKIRDMSDQLQGEIPNRKPPHY